MNWLLLIAGVVFLPFILVVLNGAPYVPTKKDQIEKMFAELKLKKGSLVVDLGSGDGVFLLLAAERGYRAVGYEINPYLVMISKWRTRKYKDLVSIKWRSFWSTDLPKDTALVFTFLAGHFMKRLDKKLVEQSRGRSFLFASVGFEVPARNKDNQTEAVFLYRYNDTKSHT